MCSMSSSNRPLRIGVTGGIGCGKSTVISVFRQMGVPCFVADQVAAEFYEEPQFVHQVAALLGSDVVSSNGTVDKKKVASIVFADKEKLNALNSIVHPLVIQRFDEWCLNQDSKYVLFESAILYEYGFDALMDKVICIYLDLEERIRRVKERDNVDRAAIEARIQNQLSAEEKMDRADWVILNYEGNPRLRQVEYIHSKFLQY